VKDVFPRSLPSVRLKKTRGDTRRSITARKKGKEDVGEEEKQERSISARIPPEDLGGDKSFVVWRVRGFNALPTEEQGNCHRQSIPSGDRFGFLSLSRLEVTRVSSKRSSAFSPRFPLESLLLFINVLCLNRERDKKYFASIVFVLFYIFFSIPVRDVIKMDKI